MQTLKDFFSPIIIGIVVTILGGIILYQFTSEQAEIKYYISEKINLSSSDTSQNVIVQQLKVQNTGNKSAANITLKIEEVEISSCELKKYALTDSTLIPTKKKENYYELTYIKLLPGTSFFLTIQTKGKEVKNENITIHHEGGAGDYVFEEKKSSNIYIIILGIINITLTIFNLVQFLRATNLDSNLWKILNIPEKFLDKKQSILVSKSKWLELRKKAIDFIFEANYIDNLALSKPYKWLDKTKDISMTDDEWEKIIRGAKRQFDFDFKMIINSHHLDNKVTDLLRLPKPKNLSDENWKPMRIKLFEKIFDKLEDVPLENSIGYTWLNTTQMEYFTSDEWSIFLDLAKNKFLFDITNNISESLFYGKWESLIELPKPIGLKEEEWIEVKKILSSAYLLKEMGEIKEPFVSVDKVKNQILNLNNLPLSDKHLKIYDYFLRAIYLRTWLLNFQVDLTKKSFNDDVLSLLDSRLGNSIKDYLDIKDMSEVTDKENKNILKLLEEIAEGKTITEKPDMVTDKNWQNLLKLQANFLKISDIESKEKTFMPLCNKVTAQLELINKIMENPDQIKFVEEYNNPFSEGNFENLKRLAELLKNQK